MPSEASDSKDQAFTQRSKINGLLSVLPLIKSNLYRLALRSKRGQAYSPGPYQATNDLGFDYFYPIGRS